MRMHLLCLIVLGSAVVGGATFAQQVPRGAVRPAIAASSEYFASLRSKPKHLSSNRLSPSVNSAAKAQDPRIITVPNFTGSFVYSGQTYSYMMVGHPPAMKRTAVIPTTYVPISLEFDEFVDQNGNNIVIDATTITGEIENSPLFQPSNFATGFTQFEDAQMRAEFWPLFTHDDNGRDRDRDDKFHVLLSNPKTLIPVTIRVPVGSSQVFVLPDGTFFALIDINFINSQLDTLVQTEPVSVTSIPIFLTRNAVYGDFFEQQPISCCVGGFHTAFQSNEAKNRIFIQTFAFSTSLDADVAEGIFGDPAVFADVNALSHELGETLNDPFVNNTTPLYQVPGLPSFSCQNNLEVGDVVENLPPDYTSIDLNGFTYHPQTLALLQWFEGIKPSNALDGDYSFPDPTKLTAPFTPCGTAR